MIDARVEKEFSVNDFGLSIGVDVFNVFNEQYTVQRNGSVNQGNIVREVTAPRVFRAGARLSFR